MKASKNSPPAFLWEEWYNSIGGRSIKIDEVDNILNEIKTTQIPKFDGSINPIKTKFESPKLASKLLKNVALNLGADEVGICKIEPEDIYKDREVSEKYAIVVGQKMLWRMFQKVPSHDSAVECLRVYYTLGEVVIQLAEYIRCLGYPCRVEHPIGDSDVLHIPLAIKAGFGEIGRHGSLINPKMGPLFRIGSVITDLDLEIDHPIDAGIAEFCDKCQICMKKCPADAIPKDREKSGTKDHLGNYLYKVDTGRCFPYFAKHNYCSICLPVCVYNHKDWAKDFEGYSTRKASKTIRKKAPKPIDPEIDKHEYPKINR
jgi:epoxyqueuosine reductase QueG